MCKYAADIYSYITIGNGVQWKIGYVKEVETKWEWSDVISVMLFVKNRYNYFTT